MTDVVIVNGLGDTETVHGRIVKALCEHKQLERILIDSEVERKGLAPFPSTAIRILCADCKELLTPRWEKK